MFDFSELEQNLNALPGRVEKAIMAYGETQGKKLERKAKLGRKWTDRTAQARNRLHSDCTTYEKGIRIILSHGVDYGAYLEFAHEKRFAVIYPTLRRYAPEVMRGLTGLLERLG